jgi:hypothetical protein
MNGKLSKNTFRQAYAGKKYILVGVMNIHLYDLFLNVKTMYKQSLNRNGAKI